MPRPEDINVNINIAINININCWALIMTSRLPSSGRKSAVLMKTQEKGPKNNFVKEREKWTNIRWTRNSRIISLKKEKKEAKKRKGT